MHRHDRELTAVLNAQDLKTRSAFARGIRKITNRMLAKMNEDARVRRNRQEAGEKLSEAHTWEQLETLRENTEVLQKFAEEYANAVEGVRENVRTLENAEGRNESRYSLNSPKYIQTYTPAEMYEIVKNNDKHPTYKNLIVDRDISLLNFINKWRNPKNEADKLEKLYLGKVTDAARQEFRKYCNFPLRQRIMLLQMILSAMWKRNTEKMECKLKPEGRK